MPAKQRDSSVLVPLFIWDKTESHTTVDNSGEEGNLSSPLTSSLICQKPGSTVAVCKGKLFWFIFCSFHLQRGGDSFEYLPLFRADVACGEKTKAM